MSKVVVSNCITLDGFFEGPHGEIDWFIPDQEFMDYSREILNASKLILMGRKTYEIMSSYWPMATKDDAVITHKMNHLPKVVFSKTLDRLKWNNSTLAKGELMKELLKLKSLPGNDILILGSGSLVKELVGKGLVDEYRLTLVPVILGDGNPMFGNRIGRVPLKLLNTKILSSGAVIHYYREDPGT